MLGLSASFRESFGRLGMQKVHLGDERISLVGSHESLIDFGLYIYIAREDVQRRKEVSHGGDEPNR